MPLGRSYRTGCGNSPCLESLVALRCRPGTYGQILQRATELCAQGLETSLAKVLEYIPDDRRLLVRAGVGWAPGTIGQVSLGIDMDLPPATRSRPAKW